MVWSVGADMDGVGGWRPHEEIGTDDKVYGGMLKAQLI